MKHIRISNSASCPGITHQDTVHAHRYYSRSLLEANFDAIVITDTYGIVFDVNDKMAEMTGYPKPELIGINWFDFFPNTAPSSIELARALKQNRVSNIELVLKSRDGHDIMVIYDEAPIYDCSTNLVGVVATIRDITELSHLRHDVEAPASVHHLYNLSLVSIQ